MANKIGTGLFTRTDNSCLFSCESNGYKYYIQDRKNFSAKHFSDDVTFNEWEISPSEGGSEYVYCLKRRKCGYDRYEGSEAYEKLLKITADSDRFKRCSYYEYGEDVYEDTQTHRIYMFILKYNEGFAELKVSSEIDVEKTQLATFFKDEYSSDWFSSFRDCLKFAEKRLGIPEQLNKYVKLTPKGLASNSNMPSELRSLFESAKKDIDERISNDIYRGKEKKNTA